MGETCARCGEQFAIRHGGHVTLNPPTGDIRDFYLCPRCYDDVAGALDPHEE